MRLGGGVRVSGVMTGVAACTIFQSRYDLDKARRLSMRYGYDADIIDRHFRWSGFGQVGFLLLNLLVMGMIALAAFRSNDILLWAMVPFTSLWWVAPLLAQRRVANHA